MNPTPSDDPHDDEDGSASPGLRTLSDAEAWLAKLARDGDAQVEITTPHRLVGGGLLIVKASLVRADGSRVNIEVYCYDDRQPTAARADLFPLPPAAVLPGAN